MPDPEAMPDSSAPGDLQPPAAAPAAPPSPSVASAGSAPAEVYVRAVASVPGLPQDAEGWLPNNEATQALIGRELVVAIDPPETEA